MTQDGEPREEGPDRMEPAEAWLATLDALLRGLAHALSNRVAAVSAVVGAQEPDDPDPELSAALVKEVRRLEGMLGLFRLLGSNDAAAASAVQLTQLLDAAVALHEHHFELRDITCRVQGAAEALPVHVPERAASRAVLALLTGAKAQAVARGSDVVELTCSATPEGEVRLRVTPGPARATGDDAGSDGRERARDCVRAAAWLLRGSAVTVTAVETPEAVTGELRLLSLPEARRRERLARQGG